MEQVRWYPGRNYSSEMICWEALIGTCMTVDNRSLGLMFFSYTTWRTFITSRLTAYFLGAERAPNDQRLCTESEPNAHEWRRSTPIGRTRIVRILTRLVRDFRKARPIHVHFATDSCRNNNNTARINFPGGVDQLRWKKYTLFVSITFYPNILFL